MFEINMTINEQLRNARDLKPFIESLEVELVQVREQFKSQPALLAPQETEILTAIREITARRQYMADLINQLSDEKQRKILTLQYIEGVKTKHLVEASGLKDNREVSSIRQKAIKNLEKLLIKIEQPET
ncbi:TPA: sigma-70 family RNA polymerase sigma factor [Streptococcus suis]|uniref:sigma-70 family RNA polymerase sigma factor n=1 Tax=Streptococcus suis TaxID=1307 RepID=UPI0004020F94|nr:sigma-70 family RNA polymerase sigma factor [Streptococcus suis]MBL6514823.1 sigma-70 family RNA polymerase sigma factor [Streptococcus suis]QZS51850.1 sigma-70 family RNA polymerase sigma factor [Streptococcus suis]HEM3428040.1 sigma-70 family RNA polymerase sigma factor [Streptococcus suis]HEM3450572.1 sigma-70 family RNA polymerase sigma factor [Streptococcus suis]HEM3498193.1 sigma-70 family RNA polymerase sigma factor [Streptococcus suis]